MAFLLLLLALTSTQATSQLLYCGEARYSPSNYTCYDGDFLCPVLHGELTLRCGPDCYLPEMYSCANNHLVYPPFPSTQSNSSCVVTTQHLSDPPYENYFYSDCHSAAHAVVTSPLPDSNLTIIGPRLVVAWPAGNSGVCMFFQPQNGVNGSLGIELINSTIGSPLAPVYSTTSGTTYPTVGVTGVVSFNSSAELVVSILGSVRTIRDFSEGPSLLQPIIQNAIVAAPTSSNGASLSRLWLDNITTTTFTLTPYNSNTATITITNTTLTFPSGTYTFTATFDYPQLTQLTASSVLSPSSQSLTLTQPDQTTSLSFLSYTQKLLAGTWRFLTYFGRDSMISALLLQPILSQGNGSAMEAVIGAVLERLNRTDGSVCHEETIGDYATYLNMKANLTEGLTAPSYSYIMIDSDFYLPVLMNQYFVLSSTGQSRVSAFFAQQAGGVDPNNLNLTYGGLALINAEKIMGLAAPFAAPGSQTSANLLRLKEGQIVGQWRDSTYGLGGGRVPFDVNTALCPAALRAIASLARASPSIYPSHPDWGTLADSYAQVWEDETLQFFETSISASTAVERLNTFVGSATFYNGPTQADSLPTDGSNVTYPALALMGYDNISVVDAMHTDDSFRHFLLNTTNQSQLSSLLNQTALNILRPFPAGLTTPVGMVVANPALSSSAVLTANFTNSAYHGTVVWSWPLAMMARGLELQLGRCEGAGSGVPDYCSDGYVYGNVKKAYNSLWDTIEANEGLLSSEVWSWVYSGGKYQVTPLGALPPPPGVGSGTESDVRQLWSLTFLAVKRNSAFG